MQVLKARLIESIKRAPGVVSFRFGTEIKPDFIPGQFLQLIFDPELPEGKELNKFLSFSSSPKRDYIEVTKRLSESSFSKSLNSLKINDEVLIKAPLGSCVFKNNYEKIGFLIGGIGITPVISIIEYIMDNKLTTNVALFYSNRTEMDIAFRPELDCWQGENKNIKVFYAVTDCPSKDNRCIFGRISKDLVLNNDPEYKERIFFIFGPPKMVEAMSALCLEIGCQKENIKTENFIGY